MNKCRICGNDNNTEELIIPEMMFGTKEEFTYFRCSKCDCLQIKTIPENLGDYYRDDYYSYAKIQNVNVNEHVQKQPGSILDVGCGSGKYLWELALQGYTDLTGCDPFIEEDIFYENGIKIYKKSIHEMEGKYDLIFLNDSYEHVTDPHEVMDSIHRLLKDDGIARIQVPVFPNIAFELYNTFWYQLDAPRHIIIHSVKSLMHVATQHGLEIVNSKWNSNDTQFVRSFLYSKGISFYEQTPDIIGKYFTDEDARSINNTVEIVNENHTGDHAIFLLKKK